jgi:hypothetical protein
VLHSTVSVILYEAVEEWQAGMELPNPALAVQNKGNQFSLRATQSYG